MPKDKKAAPRRAKLKLVPAKAKAVPKRRKALPLATVKAIIRRVMGELRKQNTAHEDGLDRLIRALRISKTKRRKAG